MTAATISIASTAEDIAAVARLFEAYAASIRIDLSYQDFAGELAGLPGKYGPPGGALLLARNPDGVAIGCVALRALSEAGCGEIKRLYVAPEGRGLGLGHKLVAAILAEAQRIGYSKIRLDTLAEMEAAKAVYRAAGFRPIPPYYITPVAGTEFLGLSLEP